MYFIDFFPVSWFYDYKLTAGVCSKFVDFMDMLANNHEKKTLSRRRNVMTSQTTLLTVLGISAQQAYRRNHGGLQ